LYIIYVKKRQRPRWKMSVLEVPAHAKINISLDVLGKREDGYHELRMIMQTIDLHDRVMIETTEDVGITLECDNKWVPTDSRNTVWKAAKLLMEHCGIKSGIKINIRKRIPIAAGLAGGSADAAAVLRGLNKLFFAGLDQSKLKELGRQVGADVPFCIEGGTMLAEGIGERLTPLRDFGGVDIVLVKPKIGVSTAWVYENLNTAEIMQRDRPDTEFLISALTTGNSATIAGHMKNVLELVTTPRYGIVQEAKDCLMRAGALGSMMSGSGPTVFGIFSNTGAAIKAYDHLSKDRRWQCFRTKTGRLTQE
jgi:4-diphosphocytidyl-2-C-methyl-D-erythritol kinase